MMFRTKSFLKPYQMGYTGVSEFIHVHCNTLRMKSHYLTILSFIEQHGKILLFRWEWNLIQSKLAVHSQIFLYI